MHKCDFCLQEHEIEKLCNVKQALNFLFYSGHVEQYDHFNTGNWKFRMQRNPPAMDLLESRYFCKVSLKKFIKPIADQIINLYTDHGLRQSWFTQAQIDSPRFQLHKFHERVDQQWR